MNVTFWGVRGSIPSPGCDTAKYGGNTSCVEVSFDENKFLVLDCGSGIRLLGKHILQNHSAEPIKSYILLSHTHWDHIQGFPFFAPAFIGGNDFTIYGPYEVNKKLEDTLAGQMEYRYFPVKLSDLKSKISINELRDKITIIDGVEVERKYLNHTSPTLGFKIKHNDKTFVYATDNEPYHTAESDPYASYKNDYKDGDLRLIEFFHQANLLILDAQYTPEEYLQKVGWGHSNWQYAVQLAKEADVKKLVLFHHDPEHTDQKLDEVLTSAKKYAQAIGYNGEISLAKEGETIEV